MKKYYNFLFILGILIILFPIFILISILILYLCGKPIFYIQKRIGKNGQIFKLYKFRTMIKNADNLKNKYLKHNEAKGVVFKIHNDPRFTSIGKFLSHTGLDELPQLFNVLKGEMSLIGPRPLPIDESNKLKSWQKKRLTIKPGIISPWILEGYHQNSFDNWMKSDLKYISKKSFKYDLQVFINAILLAFKLIISEIFYDKSSTTLRQ